jgi:ketosteroid isomerase-like protein
MPEPERVMRSLIDAFAARDEEGMRSALADDVTAYVTNADGGVDPVHGRDAYVRRLLALRAPELTVGVTQSVTVAPDQALTMVEIQADRGGKRLHNFSAFLATVTDGQVVELWMVEALPASSDEFWK